MCKEQEDSEMLGDESVGHAKTGCEHPRAACSLFLTLFCVVARGKLFVAAFLSRFYCYPVSVPSLEGRKDSGSSSMGDDARHRCSELLDAQKHFHNHRLEGDALELWRGQMRVRPFDPRDECGGGKYKRKVSGCAQLALPTGSCEAGVGHFHQSITQGMGDTYLILCRT